MLLGEVMGPAGMLSYALLIPLETVPAGLTASATAMAVSSTPVAYTRAMSVAGTTIGRSDSVTISTSDIGSVARVDLPKFQASAEYHSGDTNQDHKFELLELLREIELFTSTADHSYHCDSLGEDGFDVGPGDEECAPHSGDYDPQDWKFLLAELLRMIELYSGTGATINTTRTVRVPMGLPRTRLRKSMDQRQATIFRI